MSKYHVYVSSISASRFIVEADSPEDAIWQFENGGGELDPFFMPEAYDIGEVYDVEEV